MNIVEQSNMNRVDGGQGFSSIKLSFILMAAVFVFCSAALLWPVIPNISLAIMGCLIGLGISYVAIKAPIIPILGVLVTAVIPYSFIIVEFIDPEVFELFGGLNIPDVFMLAMCGAVALEFFLIRSKLKSWQPMGVARWVMVFSALLLFEIVRNIGTYGLSAPGEFRFRYLILILPLYIAVFFDTPELRKRLLVILISVSTVVIILSAVSVGVIKGWSIGPDDRFLPAQLSMGMFQGLLALFIAQKYKLIRSSQVWIWMVLIPVGILMLVDGHRSAWMASVVILGVMFLRKEFSVRLMLWMLLPALSAIVIVWIAVSSTGLDILGYVGQRASAYVNPQEDTSSAWRLFLWAAQLQKFVVQPLFGEGFGGYWEVYVPELNQVLDVQPHSLYVQTLVKMGITGLAVYLITISKTLWRFYKWLAVPDQKKNQNML